MSADTLTRPFGGISFTELRSRAADAREIDAKMREALPAWFEKRSPEMDDVVTDAATPLSFEEVLHSDAGASEGDDGSARPRSTARLVVTAAACVLAPLAAGASLLYGLVATTAGFSTPPEWFPTHLLIIGT